MEDLVTIKMQNYRDIQLVDIYDKVSSIGMFEHVGLENLPSYCLNVNLVLKSGSLFLNHGITSDDSSWNRGVSTKSINRHVFPDGELDTVNNIQHRTEETSFEIFDIESLRSHYALTVDRRINRLDAKLEKAVKLVGERTYRVWRLYMTDSALQFEQGVTEIYLILPECKKIGYPNPPLARRDLYATSQAH